MSSLFLQMLNLSVAAGWIVLVVILLRFCLKKAPRWITCLLWGLVALRLILPFSIESPISLVPTAQLVVQTEVEKKPVITVDSGVSSFDTPINDWLLTPVVDHSDDVSVPSSSGSSVSSNEGEGSESNPSLPPMDNSQEKTAASPLRAERMLDIAVPVWLVGVALMLLYELVSAIIVRRRVLDAVLLHDNVWQSDRVRTTFIFGILSPRIYVPNGIDEASLELILAHETSHLKRMDHWIKPLAFTLLAVYWYNPLLWVAYLLLCRDIEVACDERVVRDLSVDQRRTYATALLQCGSERRALIGCPLAFGELSVKQRIFSVIGYRKPVLWVVFVSLLVCLLAAVCLLTVPQSVVAHEVAVTPSTPTNTTTTTSIESTTTLMVDSGTSVNTTVNSIHTTSSHQSDSTTSHTSSPSTHTHTYDSWKVVLSPKCSTEGRAERECSCGKVEIKSIPAVGHTYIQNVCVTCGELDSQAFFPDYSAGEENVVGNGMGSYHLATQGDWLYFATESCRISKSRTDGTQMSTIWSGSSGTIANINVVGDWVYFFVKGSTVEKSYIGKVRTDGEGFAYLLQSVNVGEMLVVKDRLFFTTIKSPYSDYAKDAGPLYTMLLSGGMTQLLHDGYVSHMSSDGNYLYFKYAPETGTKSVYRINLSTFARSTLIATFKAAHFIIKDGRIYYAQADADTGEYIIKSAALTGGAVTNHGRIPDAAEWLCVIDNCVYYYGKPYGDEYWDQPAGIVEFNRSTGVYRVIYETYDVPDCYATGDCLVLMDYVGSTLSPIRVFHPQTSQWTEISVS